MLVGMCLFVGPLVYLFLSICGSISVFVFVLEYVCGGGYVLVPIRERDKRG